MFVTAPGVLSRDDSVRMSSPLASPEAQRTEPLAQLLFLQAVVEGFLDGVMIVSSDQTIVQSNLRARQLCRRLNAAKVDKSTFGHVETFELQLPDEIWRVCQAALDSFELFPAQSIVPESEVQCGSRARLRIRAQRIELAVGETTTDSSMLPCLLVTLEDRGQAIQNVAIADMQKFDLTPREGQVWQLRLAGRTYREIATELYITDNTVKKHIKSILAKRRTLLDED